jgi:hypothetical protein
VEVRHDVLVFHQRELENDVPNGNQSKANSKNREGGNVYRGEQPLKNRRWIVP